jgi:AraC-like DNA-binding protein
LSDLDYEAPHAVAVFTLDRQAICIEDDCDYEFSRRLEIGLQKRFSIDLFVESDKECIVLFRADCADANVFAAELTDCLDPGLLRALTVSIGGFYSLAFINHSYTEALYAFNMGRIYSVQMNIYCYNRLPKDIESKPIRNPTIEELELAVRKRNEEGYTRLLNTMFKEDISVMEYNHNLYMAATLLIRLYDKDSVTFLDEINGLITDKGIMNTAVVKHFFYTKFKAFEADYRTDFNQYMNKINRFVGECYTTDFSLDELAASVGLTKPYLCNWFQQHYGTTIVDYVNRYRTNQAKELLSGSSAKISVVGRMVGFNSNSYFTKIFREYNGITPTEYRELSWNKNESPNNPVAILVDG